MGLLTGLLNAVVVWRPSAWSDEAVTISLAQRPLSGIVRIAGETDAVHSSYYAVVHLWMQLTGPGPTAVRLLSVLAVALGAAGCVVLGNWLGMERGPALWSGVIFGLLPRMSWAASEGRPFAVTALAAVLVTMIAVRLADGGGLRRGLLYGGGVAVATLLNVYLLLLVPAHLVAALAIARDRPAVLRRFATSAGPALVALAPFVLFVRGQGGQLGVPDYGIVGLARRVVVNQYFIGSTPNSARATEQSAFPLEPWAVTSVLMGLLTVGAMAWWLATRAGPLLRRGERQSRAVVWGGSLVLVPTGLLTGVALLSPSLYSPRYLTFTCCGVALFAADALSRVSRRAAVAVAVTAALLALPVLAQQRGQFAKNGYDYRQASDFIEDVARPGDGVYFVPAESRDRRPMRVAYPEPFGPLVDVTLLGSMDAPDHLFGTVVPLEQSRTLATVDHLWVVANRDGSPDALESDLRLLSFTADGPSWVGPDTVIRRFVRTS